ncbi:MAG: hypothetical protein ACE5GM_07485 [bacterium]
MVKEVVRKHINRRAKIVGLVGILVYICLGYFLKIELMYNYVNWTKNFATMRGYLKAAHVHGLTLSFIILFYSFFVEVSDLTDQQKKVGTSLAIGGVVLMPLTLVMGAFDIRIALLSHMAVLMVISAVGILAWGHLK